MRERFPLSLRQMSRRWAASRKYKEKINISLVFYSICTIFAPRNFVDKATAFCTTHKIANKMRHGKTAVSSHHSNMDVGFSGIHLCRGVWRYQ